MAAGAGFTAGASGIVFEKLYIVNVNSGQTAYNYLATGATASGDHCRILDCFLAGWLIGIDWYSDSSDINENNVSNCAYGLRSFIADTKIMQNVIFSCVYNGVILSSVGGQTLANNQIAQCGLAHVLVAANQSQVLHNQIFSTRNASDDGIQITAAGAGSLIAHNTIQLSNARGGQSTGDNTSGDGIRIGVDAAASRCAIIGNIVENAGGTNSTGYAIAFRNSSTLSTVIGNIIPAGKFRSGGSPSILWGTGNLGITLNSGE